MAEYLSIRKAAFIAEGIMGKRQSEEDPLAYWTLINTLLEICPSYHRPLSRSAAGSEETNDA